VDLRTTRSEALRPGDWVTIKRATCWRVRAPDPLIVSWQGRDLRVRHDDPHLGTYTPRGAVIRSAVELASDAAGQVRLYPQDTWPARAIAATSETPSDPTRP
jgi:hypothetical protein